MKKYIPILLCILLLFASRGDAQETFAPLLTEETMFFVHVDFSKLDVDTVKAEAMTIGENFLTALGFDARSKTATLRDLESELEKLDAMVRPIWETITEDLGITEFAWIADDSFYELNMYTPIFVVPWKGKTDEDFETLLSLMPQDILLSFMPPPHWGDECIYIGDVIFPAGEFLVFCMAGESYQNFTQNRQVTTEWIENAVANKDLPVHQVLRSLRQSDEIKIVVTVPKSMKQEIRDDPRWVQDMSEQVANLNFFAAETIEWIAVSLPVSEILTGTIENDLPVITIKLPSADDATMLRELMDSAIEAGIDSSEEMPPLVREFVKGYLRTLLPDVEGDKLVFRAGQVKHVPFLYSAFWAYIML